MKNIILMFLLLVLILPSQVLARRTSVDDEYQAKRSAYQLQLKKLSPQNQDKIKQADKLLVETNQKVLVRFDDDIAKMTAVLEEYKSRQNLEGANTKVAYGQGDSQLDQAAYWLNYAAEAVAYQKIADYTPQISDDASVPGAINRQVNILKADLTGLKAKILTAKVQILKVIK